MSMLDELEEALRERRQRLQEAEEIREDLGREAELLRETNRRLEDEVSAKVSRIEELEERLALLEDVPERADFLWNDRLETIPQEGHGRYLFSTNLPDGAMSMTDFAGRRCLMLVNRSSQRDQNGRCRTELGPYQVNPSPQIFRRLPFREDLWIHFQLAIDRRWPFVGHKVVTGQIHSDPDVDDGGGRNPPVSLNLVGQQFKLRVLHDSRPVSPGGPQNLREYTVVERIEPDTWYPFTLHVCLDWSEGGVGLTELYLGPRLIVQERQPNCYNDEKPCYFCGWIYFPQAIAPGYPQSEVRRLYVSRFRIGGKQHSLVDVTRWSE